MRLRRIGDELRYAGRGGPKLEAALAAFGLDPRGRVCLDLGASTGRFSDCLLHHGARRVFAIDVGHGQLALRLRSDARVVVREKLNACRLRLADLGEAVDLIVANVAFISATLLIPALAAVLDPGGAIVILVKPQFEAGPRAGGNREYFLLAER